MKSGIYKITNDVTGKFYIGSSKDINFRWDYHKYELNKNTHGNPRLQHSWNFYGADKFSLSILEEIEPIDDTSLIIREQYYLDTFKPYIRGVGYNICPTAKGGDNITNHPNRDAFIEKMSDICSGENNPMFGRKHTDETIKKQKDKAKGRYTLDWFIERYGKNEGHKQFDERRLMLANRKINYTYDNGCKGRKNPMSEEAKRKLSETKLRMKDIKHLIIKDIKSDRYTMSQISEKYRVPLNVIKYYKRKLKNNSL